MIDSADRGKRDGEGSQCMTTVKPEQIDQLMERASEALAETRYFEAERLALQALRAARKARQYDELARICLPLQEARRQRMLQAIDASADVRVVNEPFDEESLELEPGCYLVEPQLVGADARRLRARALEDQVPAIVVCREPTTQLGLIPIVALGDSVFRTKVRPPKNPDSPDKTWFVDAAEAIGDAAMDQIDPELEPERLVDALLVALDAIPEHEKLHQRLAEAAKEAAKHLAREHEDS